MMLAKLQPVVPVRHAQDTTLLAEVLPWLILLLGLVIAGGIVIFWIRRSMDAKYGGGMDDAGFTLHDLRMLHQQGKLTDEEFASARTALIGKMQSNSDSETPEASDNGGQT